MVVNTTKDGLGICRLVGQKADSATVEGDIIVPDIKPDILNAIHTSGNVCIYKKEVLDGKIRLDGVVNTYVIYVADTENASVRGLNSSLDFTKVIEVDEARAGMDLDEMIEVKRMDCQVLMGER